MTFCLGMKLKEGLVGIADTRITSGTEVTVARKVTVYQKKRHSFFLMTSGLRSVRDKALTYFEEVVDEQDQDFDRLYKAVNAFATQIKRVAAEDREALEAGGFGFNISCLVGGQLENDAEHKLYLLYAQGNWVEIMPGTPFHIIGESGYGKPILVRALEYEDPLWFALKVGLLAFESTRISASDVDYPIDVVVYAGNSYQIEQHRYSAADLAHVAAWWQTRLRDSVHELPSEWTLEAFNDLPPELRERLRHSAMPPGTPTS
ncbi:MAG: peptidase [Lentisphaerae bacterium]|nr:peptidase [Lentisphaerota bacterium]